jgi:hypothetical protein
MAFVAGGVLDARSWPAMQPEEDDRGKDGVCTLSCWTTPSKIRSSLGSTAGCISCSGVGGSKPSPSSTCNQCSRESSDRGEAPVRLGVNDVAPLISGSFKAACLCSRSRLSRHRLAELLGLQAATAHTAIGRPSMAEEAETWQTSVAQIEEIAREDPAVGRRLRAARSREFLMDFRARERVEEESFAKSMRQREKEEHLKVQARVRQANAWAKMLGDTKRFRIRGIPMDLTSAWGKMFTTGEEGSGHHIKALKANLAVPSLPARRRDDDGAEELPVLPAPVLSSSVSAVSSVRLVVMLSMPGAPDRQLSTLLFDREFAKLGRRVDLARKQRAEDMVSKPAEGETGKRASMVLIDAAAPVVEARARTVAIAARERRSKALVQGELRRALRETAFLTQALRQQIAVLKAKGWNQHGRSGIPDFAPPDLRELQASALSLEVPRAASEAPADE